MVKGFYAIQFCQKQLHITKGYKSAICGYTGKFLILLLLYISARSFPDWTGIATATCCFCYLCFQITKALINGDLNKKYLHELLHKIWDRSCFTLAEIQFGLSVTILSE